MKKIRGARWLRQDGIRMQRGSIPHQLYGPPWPLFWASYTKAMWHPLVHLHSQIFLGCSFYFSGNVSEINGRKDDKLIFIFNSHDAMSRDKFWDCLAHLRQSASIADGLVFPLRHERWPCENLYQHDRRMTRLLQQSSILRHSWFVHCHSKYAGYFG